MRTRTLRAGNRGFTLLETIIVLFIAGLAVSVVVVSTGRLRERALFNAEARKIYQTLKRAREVSLLERKNAAVRVDPETNRYWIEYDGGTQRPLSVPAGFSISGKDIFFFPKGNSSGGRILLVDAAGKGYAIRVDPVLGTPTIKRL
ncbi:MAG: prepilin-type N-terminal cleavage/methylation domain-containing protein [Nitrospiraceae bacterium]|nr:prepilin-type N-terminal cleavage/methylation domain-containing protein [Nitrospiraceae bacterium]